MAEDASGAYIIAYLIIINRYLITPDYLLQGMYSQSRPLELIAHIPAKVDSY